MATNVITPDPETMSLEDLRKLAETEAHKQSTTPPTKQVTPTHEEEEEEETVVGEKEEVEKEFVAQKSFDLGDGAGSQVYKGHGATREDALEDLSNKLIEAQKSATRRIKELKATTPAKAVETVSKEDEALLAAELVQKPSEVVAKILKKLGVDIAEVKESTDFVKNQKVKSTRKSAADAFVATHPEYVDTDKNAAKINKWCELHSDFSLEGMNKAYQDLNESGLLQVKGEEAGHGQDEDRPETRTEEKAEVISPRVTKKASGLSTHRRTPVAVATQPSEDELYSMPLEKLRQLSNKVLAGQ